MLYIHNLRHTKEYVCSIITATQVCNAMQVSNATVTSLVSMGNGYLIPLGQKCFICNLKLFKKIIQCSLRTVQIFDTIFGIIIQSVLCQNL